MRWHDVEKRKDMAWGNHTDPRVRVFVPLPKEQTLLLLPLVILVRASREKLMQNRSLPVRKLLPLEKLCKGQVAVLFIRAVIYSINDAHWWVIIDALTLTHGRSHHTFKGTIRGRGWISGLQWAPHGHKSRRRWSAFGSRRSHDIGTEIGHAEMLVGVPSNAIWAVIGRGWQIMMAVVAALALGTRYQLLLTDASNALTLVAQAHGSKTAMQKTFQRRHGLPRSQNLHISQVEEPWPWHGKQTCYNGPRGAKQWNLSCDWTWLSNEDGCCGSYHYDGISHCVSISNKKCHGRPTHIGALFGYN